MSKSKSHNEQVTGVFATMVAAGTLHGHRGHLQNYLRTAFREKARDKEELFHQNWMSLLAFNN